MTIIAEDTKAYYNQCIADGFVYECACGEMFRTIDHAATCRKCRNYTWAGYCTHVTDVRTGAVVDGRRPTEEEDRAAEAAYNARIAEEQAEWEADQAAAREEADWAAEALLWDIQDRLNN